jgi:predicted phosphodiesterase
VLEDEKPKPLKRLFFLSDPHIPYHDKRGLKIALAALKRFKPDIVVSVGDFVDFFSVSSYSKDPSRALLLDKEVGQATVVLDQIGKLAPNARRIYIAGNHEDRLQRYLQDKAPELYSFVNLEKLLGLKDRGWEYVPYKQSIRIGKLNITHDVGVSTRYAAYRAMEAFQAPVVTGHTHRMAYAVEGDARGGSQVSAMFGWLGDVKQVDYMHRIKAQRNWALGFGVGYIAPVTGYAYLVPIPIVNYSAVVEGKLYAA